LQQKRSTTSLKERHQSRIV